MDVLREPQFDAVRRKDVAVHAVAVDAPLARVTGCRTRRSRPLNACAGGVPVPLVLYSPVSLQSCGSAAL